LICLKSYKNQFDLHVRRVHSHVSSWAIFDAFPNAKGVCFICENRPLTSLRKHHKDHHPFVNPTIYEMAAVTATEESPFPPGPSLCCLCKMPCPDLRAHYLHAHRKHGSSSFDQGLCPRVECHSYSDNLAVHEILEHFTFIYSDQNDIDTQQQDSSVSASRTCRKPHMELSTHPSHGQGDTMTDSLSEELPSPPAQTKTSCQSCNAKLSKGNENRHWQHYCEFGRRIREPC